MLVHVGDRVIILKKDEDYRLFNLVGKIGVVKAVMTWYHPASATVFVEDANVEATVYIRHLEVIPPEDAPFKYEEQVVVKTPYATSAYHVCNKNLVGKLAEIHGYDKRDGSFFVKSMGGESGWFPANCLVPVGFQGTRYFYPGETVKLDGKEAHILKTRRSRNGLGQLLLINGKWLPSTDVV